MQLLSHKGNPEQGMRNLSFVRPVSLPNQRRMAEDGVESDRSYYSERGSHVQGKGRTKLRSLQSNFTGHEGLDMKQTPAGIANKAHKIKLRFRNCLELTADLFVLGFYQPKSKSCVDKLDAIGMKYLIATSAIGATS